jgi:DNA repair photolyase
VVQVFCSVGEAEVYGLIKRSKDDLVLMLETKSGYMLRDLLSIEKNRSNNDMRGQRTRA